MAAVTPFVAEECPIRHGLGQRVSTLKEGAYDAGDMLLADCDLTCDRSDL